MSGSMTTTGVGADYVKSLSSAWDHVSFWKGLNAINKQEILRVQELFCLHMGGTDIPDAIRFVTEKSGFMFIFTQTTHTAAVASSTIQYQASTWESRMKGRGKLRTYALDMINEICSYQSARELANDTAECMFLEELKHWATFELALYELRKDNLEMIQKRIRYMEAVLAQESLFYSLRWRSRTVQRIIIESCLRLKYQVVPEIKNEIALKCAREQLSEFRYELKEALQQGVYFLYHVFRDSGKVKLDSVTMGRLIRNEGEVMETSTGKLLFHILTSGAFLDAFPDDSVEIRKRMGEFKIDEEDVSVDNKMDTATLFDKEGHVVLPRALWLEMTGDVDLPGQDPVVPMNKDNLTRLFAKSLGTRHTGMETGFHGHPYVAEQMIKAHAALQELAKFVQIIIKAEKCAGGGGDLLIYGFANKQLNGLLQTYRSLVKTVRSQFEVLTRIAELRFQQLAEKNQAEPERNTFIPHYRQIHTKFYHFDNQLSRTEDCCDEILSKANSLTLYERFNKLKKDTEDFITTADTFAGHLHNVLHIPYNKAIGQQITLSGPNIPNVESLMRDTRRNLMRDPTQDVLPYALDFLESSSVGTVKVHAAPPELLLLTEHGEEPEETISMSSVAGSSQREKVPVIEEPSRSAKSRHNTHTRQKSFPEDLSSPNLSPEKDLAIEELQQKLKAAEATQLSQSLNLTRLPSTEMPPPKQPKWTIPWQKMGCTHKTISGICLQLEGLLKRPGPVILQMKSSFDETVAFSHLMQYLVTHADRFHTLDFSNNAMSVGMISELLVFLTHPYCKLKQLIMDRCNMNHREHGKKLVELLSFNKTLRHVSLQNNNWNEETVHAFQEAFNLNTDTITSTLVSLHLYRTNCNGSAEAIGFPISAVSELETNVYRDPKRIVYLIDPTEVLTKGEPTKLAAYNRYQQDCKRRSEFLKQEKIKKKESKLEEKKRQDATLFSFRRLITIIQAYCRSYRTKIVPKTVINFAYSLPLYGVTDPVSESFVLKLCVQAVDLNILENDKDDNGPGYRLAPFASGWEPPLPSAAALLMAKDGQQLDVTMIWQSAMTAIGVLESKPMKHPQLISYFATKTALSVYTPDVFEGITELLVLRGVIYKSNEVYKLNSGDICPVDFHRFPGTQERKFVPTLPMHPPISKALTLFTDSSSSVPPAHLALDAKTLDKRSKREDKKSGKKAPGSREGSPGPERRTVGESDPNAPGTSKKNGRRRGLFF